MSQYNEPWIVAPEHVVGTDPVVILDANEKFLFGHSSDEGELSADDPKVHRVVLCVNACAHLSDDVMKQIASGKLSLIPVNSDDLPVPDSIFL